MVNLNQKLKLTKQCPTFQKGSVAHTTVSDRRVLQVSGRISMTISHGKQVCIDYSNCDFIEQKRHGTWMLNLMQYAVKSAGVREVHAHVEEFDGTLSPTGFAAVVLLDESHVSAHCYYDKGILAIDAFTCGDSDPNIIIDIIHKKLTESFENIKVVSKNEILRFRQ